VVGADSLPWLSARWRLFQWNWRDLDRCEFGALPLLAAAPLLHLRSRNPWLLRAPMALLVFVAVVTVCSPQPVGATGVADVRYLVPVIPLCVAIEALVLCGIARGRAAVALAAGALVFGTNLCNGGPLLWCGLRSTIACYAGELAHPPGDPYTDAVGWINANVREKESVWVLPDYACYPLMFHAPQALYAWQLTGTPGGQFAKLPRIHFYGEMPPDYVIVFGPQVGAVTNMMNSWRAKGLRYEQMPAIQRYWMELYRPELIWHDFAEKPVPEGEDDAVYIFKNVSGQADGKF
jgi:hypothetical protein